MPNRAAVARQGRGQMPRCPATRTGRKSARQARGQRGQEMATERRRSVIRGMTLVRILIWIGTAVFVGMMFYPLLMRMIALLMFPTDSDLPY